MLPMEGPAAAKAAGLRYTTDAIPGIHRVKHRRSFAYVAADGKPVRNRGELARIAALAIPPAYTDVWISPIANGHLQATGRDARGRKQYRYHKRWRAVRDETKFDRMVAFAKALPAIRTAVARDVAKAGMPREKVLATVVSLLEATAIRVGNEEYARDNDSYGLTTMQDQHADVRGGRTGFALDQRERAVGQELIDHAGMDVRFLAHRRRVAQPFGDVFDRLGDRGLGFGFPFGFDGGQLERAAHRRFPRAEVFGGELAAGDLSQVVVHVLGVNRPRNPVVVDVFEEVLSR